ncbi:hypothetical protein H5T87_06415, partial [bacterium]|nr:hypothetical protein [bacterium]
MGFLLGFWAISLAMAQMPQVAPLNPQFVEYQAKLQTGVAPKTVTQSGHPLGYIPPPISISHLNKGKWVPGVRQPLPSKYDLRTQGRLTPVKDQGQYVTCWAHATFGSLESTNLTTRVMVFDFSENNLVNWSADNYDTVQGVPFGWNGGNHLAATAYLSGWWGPADEADDPYPNPGPWSQKTVRQHIQQVFYLPDRTGPLDNDTIKLAVMQYGAVYTSMYYDDASFNASTNAYYYNGSEPGNHAVCIVGWDDNYPKTNFATQPPGDGAFIVRNSWGPSWGEGGYFYVSYYDSVIGTENTVFPAGEDVTNYTGIYQYDILGLTASIGYGSYTAWFANIFTATGDEPISAVSFYALAPNASYTVYVYTNVASGQPRSGTLGGVKSGIIPIPGYYTVILDAPVNIANGQKFSVVVNITTPGFDMPIPVELPIPGYSSKASARPGEGFISADGSAWDDITTYFYNTSVCLKAFAGLPTFSGGSYTPYTGTPSTIFSFSLRYNTPSKPLQYAKLHLVNTLTGNTTDYDMSSSDGIHYKARVYLARGLYNYYFTASDGLTVFRYPGQGTFTGPKVNSPPLLSNGKVTPSVGAPGDTFTFTVEYSDPDIDAAEYVKVHIKQDNIEVTGSPFTMTSKDGKVWTYSTMLTKVSGYKYYYYFSASDGIDEVSNDPIEGPTLNNPPQLLEPKVNPPFGLVGDKFTFLVTYKDMDGNMPSSVSFHIVDPDGQELSPPSLVYTGDNPKVGIQIQAQDVVLSKKGAYTFWCEAEDGYPNGKAISSKVSVGVGVIGVQASPNVLDIISQRSGTITIGFAYKPNNLLAINVISPAGNVYTPQDIQTDNEGRASLTLPTADISLSTLGEWKVEAKDKATGTCQGSATFLVKGTYQFPSALDMVSLPLSFANTKLSDIFRDQLGNLLIKGWQSGYIDISTINTGVGFWMKTKDGKPPLLTLYAGTLLSEETYIPLVKGWNIIGSPLTTDVDIASVKVKYGNQTVSLEEAAKNGWVRDYLWGYDPQTKDYVLVHSALTGDQRMVKSWKGYWARALV